MHVRAAATLVALAALAATSASPAAAPASGLYGLVTRGPTQPVCKVGTPCSAPAAGLTLLFVRAGTGTHRVRTTAAGRYRIALAPGTYSVQITTHGVGRGIRPTTVRVSAGTFTRRDFFVDTGIR